MIDGKICSTLSEVSLACCYICGATPKEMNNLKSVSTKTANEEHYKFGISTLHCWIRCFEFFLHLSYKIECKKWSVTTAEHKSQVAERKKLIKKRLRDELGILGDVVKQGARTTNNGNMARKFFSDPENSARLLEVDGSLVRKFAVILQTLASGKKIKVNAFDNFAKKKRLKIISP